MISRGAISVLGFARFSDCLCATTGKITLENDNDDGKIIFDKYLLLFVIILVTLTHQFWFVRRYLGCEAPWIQDVLGKNF